MAYTWDSFPGPCFDSTAFYAVALQWESNLESMDAEIEAGRAAFGSLDLRFDSVEADVSSLTSEIATARGGQVDLDTRLDFYDVVKTEVETARDTEANLNARLDAIEAGTRIANDAIYDNHLDFANAYTTGYVVGFNSVSGKWEWVANGAGTDTGEVRMNAADTKEYLDAKLSDGLENDGAGNVRMNGKLAYATITTPHTTAGNEMIRLQQGDAITLNAAPANNETVSFIPEDDLTITTASIARNGNTINGEAQDITVDVNIGFTMVFNSTTSDWRFR